jgi:hypothetical protein
MITTMIAVTTVDYGLNRYLICLILEIIQTLIREAIYTIGTKAVKKSKIIVMILKKYVSVAATCLIIKPVYTRLSRM